ncbi:MAG TPA: ATP-binding protein [Candidatus Acidoferrum sp.]|nr:ATP-binding protein [Candidatus Acidoferrum sp.]
MKKRKPERASFQRLRQQAEALLRKSPRAVAAMPGGDVQKLVHELEVHREELELQNEELRRVQRELEVSRDRFAALYDSAPVGYLTLDAAGVILEANLTAATLLGVERDALVRRKLSGFITAESQDVFFLHRQQVFSRETHQSCELRMCRAGGVAFDAQIQCVLAADGESGRPQCRAALSDITERKQMEQERASREELRRLAAHLEAAREEERTRVAREIHDVLAQGLTQLKLDIAWLNRRLAEPLDAGKQELLHEKLKLMTDQTDTVTHTVQKIATELRPVVLDSLGLCAAIEWQAADFQTRTEIRCEAAVPSKDIEMTRDCATAVFRILQESLTNVARHAQATKVQVRLRRQADELFLTVRDNGRGIRASEEGDSRSVGLLGMRERALLLNGQCKISGQDGKGTSVELRLPLGASGEAEAKRR